MKKNLNIQLGLTLLILIFSGSSLFAQIDFNNTGDLASYFNANTAASAVNASTGGLSNSGNVSFSGSANDLFTLKTGYSTTGSGDSFYTSGYFYYNSNNGYGNLGFAPSDVNEPGSSGGPVTGLSVAFHGGGMFWLNDGATASSISWSGVSSDLPLGNWYKFILTMVNNGTSFDLTLDVWYSDASGNLSSLATSESLLAVNNASLMGASTVYPCFGARYNRIPNIDNFDSGFTPGGGGSSPQNVALDFDGTNGQGVETATMIPYNATSTVMAWHYKKSTTSRVFTWGSPQVNKYVTMEFYNNQFRSYSPIQGEGKVETTSGYPNNAWYHIAVVKDAGTVTIYINGAVAASGPQGYSITPTKTSLGAGLFNNYWQGNGNGITDELSVWDVALSATEINNYMATSPVGTEAGMVAFYDFNTPGVTPGGNNAGYTTLYDVTGHGYDGTLLNFPLNGATGNWVEGQAPAVVEATWLGTTGYSWSNPANWSTGVVPDASTNVTIPAGTPYPCGYFDAVDCNDITIEAGASINSGHMYGLSYGSFINHGTITNNGGLMIAFRSYPDNEIDWHLVSPPVSSSLSGVFEDEYLQWFDEPNNTYHEIIPTDVPLNVMQGYAIYSTTANNYFAFSGTFNSGPQSINVTNSGTAPYGWNLVGNPYPTSLDWNLAIPGLSGINSSIYYLDAATGNWLTWNGTTGGGSQYIPPHQGFFVSVSAASATLSVDNSMRTHNGATQLFYKEGLSNHLVLKAEGNGFEDKTYIHFNENATENFDGQYDAYKIFSEYNDEIPQLYTVANDDQLSINELPEAESIVAGLKANTAGEYTISIAEETDMANVILEDVVSGTFTNLHEQDYTFYYDNSTIGDRFIVHFTPLSVEEINDVKYNIYAFDNQVNVIAPDMATGTIRILNTIGQVVSESNLTSGTNRISIDKAGAYIVEVICDNSIETKKVIIK